MNNVHGRAKRGIKLMLMRQGCLQILTFAGGVLLARTLGPSRFGLFAIANFLVVVFGLLGDFGLAPSFIQRRDELTEADLQVGFTLQQVLTTLVVAAIFVLAPVLTSFYPRVPHSTMIWLIRALAFSLYLTSWRAISALQLERQLRYDKLAWIEVVESLSYQAVAVGLVLLGFGVWSLVCALLTRGVLGTMLVFAAAPWQVRLRYDATIARDVLRYGIPFQAQEITNAASAWISPVLVAMLIGPQAVGLLTWASSNGKKPMILVDSVMRVAFAHFSRIQDDRDAVERILIRYLTYLLLPAGLWFAVLLTAGPSLVHWIYTDKWAPAVPALIIFAAVLSLDVTRLVVGLTLNSLGLVGFATRIVLLRVVADVVVSVLLVLLIGYNGVPLADLAVYALAVPLMFAGLSRGTLGRVARALAWVLIPVLTGVLVGELMARAPLPLVPRALVTASSVCTAFLAASWLSSPRWLTEATLAMVLRRIRAGNVQVAVSQ